jgi:hypothetical protein
MLLDVIAVAQAEGCEADCFKRVTRRQQTTGDQRQTGSDKGRRHDCKAGECGWQLYQIDRELDEIRRERGTTERTAIETL